MLQFKATPSMSSYRDVEMHVQDGETFKVSNEKKAYLLKHFPENFKEYKSKEAPAPTDTKKKK